MEITKDGKLLNATVGDQPIDDNKLYTVATIDYLADGNGSMEAFLQAENVMYVRKEQHYADSFLTM